MVKRLRSGRRTNANSAPDEGSGDALLQQAAALYNSGELSEAATVYRKLAVLRPDDPVPRYLRGLISFQEQRYSDAEIELRAALAHVNEERPLGRDVRHWLAKTLVCLKRPEEAKEVVREVVKWSWNDPVQLSSCIDPMIEVDAFDELEPILRRIVEAQPENPRANAELSLFEFREKNYKQAMERALLASRLDPKNPAALRVLGHVYHDLGETGTAISFYLDAMTSARAGNGPLNTKAVYESMLGGMVYSEFDDHKLRQAHQGWESIFPIVHRVRPATRHRGDRPLRVGYVSPDFRDHAVAFFLEPLLHNHSSELVSVLLYSNTKKHDEVTQRIRGLGFEWRDIVRQSDEAVAEQIREDKIDILVDLAGFTVDNRMGVFGLAPAPLQLTYLGYPCTTGLSTIDYRLTDEYCDPLGETDALYTEQLVRLPGGFYAWRPPEHYPPVADSPALERQYITFGSLNTLAKISDDVIALWSSLLAQVDRARLVLQAAPLVDEWVRDRVYKKFQERGIERDRIDLFGRMSTYEHLELYNQIDIALDPFPWGGHTTTCTALFMGVPVVTLRGRRMASRMSASALHRMGFDAWIAETPEQYLHIAAKLAGDVERLATIRQAQRMVFATSGLMDGHRLARAVEAAYLAIWDHHAGTETT
jgi:predicted O-linked N-acetylglucosamine transferase (SPINDLY family)